MVSMNCSGVLFHVTMQIKEIIYIFFNFLKSKKGEKIILTGSGPTVTKAITCAEIIKRKTRVSQKEVLCHADFTTKA